VNSDIETVRRALGRMPASCRYHGDRLLWSETTSVRTAMSRPDDPCCETGRPALYRREALAALERIASAVTVR